MNFCSRLVRRSQGRAIRFLTNVLCVYIRSACGTSCSNKPLPTWWCFRDFVLLRFCKWLCGWCLPLRHLVWWIPQPLPPAFCFVSNLHTKCRFSFLTSSTCHPKFVGKERCNALMTFHEHCFADCLLVLRKVYLYCYDCLCERQHFVDAHPDL